MRHRFITRKRDGLHWVVGTRLVAEFGEPEGPLEMPKPPKGVGLFDERHRPLYILTAEGELEYRGRSSEEIDADTEREKRRSARARLRETDWYVIRMIETGKAIPPDIITERTQRRVEASE